MITSEQYASLPRCLQIQLDAEARSELIGDAISAGIDDDLLADMIEANIAQAKRDMQEAYPETVFE